MGDERNGGLGRRAFRGTLLAVSAIVIAQSVVHLVVVLQFDRVGTLVDLDRSNGLPDLVSTIALALAALGAATVARLEDGEQRVAAAALATVLAVLMVADFLHDGAHPSSTTGWYVIALVGGTGLLLVVIGLGSGTRARVALVAAGCILVCSFLVTGVDRLDQRLLRDRGDPVAEYQIVTKEGLELLGWSLVALALCDEALRRRAQQATATGRAFRGRAASRRRAA